MHRLLTCGTRTTSDTWKARRWYAKKFPFMKKMEWIIIHNNYYLVYLILIII